MRMTLDELINAMEPQARKDKALISKCVDGLTEYAAELRQKAGDAGKEQISALRRLVDELAGYWGLDAKTVDHVTAFDRKIQEVDQAVHQWTPTQEHKVGANSEKECGFQCVECLIPSLREMINDAIADAGGLAPAEKMATLLKQKQRIWNEDAIIKYKAILEASGCSGLQDAIRLMEDLDQYELRPDVAQPWGYAELVLREKYPDLPEALFQTGQSAEIGRKLLEDRNGVITEYGLIRRLDGQPVQSLHEAPEQNGMEMI